MTLDEMRLELAPAGRMRPRSMAGARPRSSPPRQRRASIPRWPLLAFPGGAMDMIEAWVASVDAAMARRCRPNCSPPCRSANGSASLV